MAGSFHRTFLETIRGFRRELSVEQVAAGYARGLEQIALESTRSGHLDIARGLLRSAARVLDLQAAEIPGLEPAPRLSAKEAIRIESNQLIGGSQRLERLDAALQDPGAAPTEHLLAAEAMSWSFGAWTKFGVVPAARQAYVGRVANAVMTVLEAPGTSDHARQAAVDLLTRSESDDRDGIRTADLATFLRIGPEALWQPVEQLA
ncbi:MAG: hypothetical protein ACOYN3_02655 [Acidimicrobiia bacterium]